MWKSALGIVRALTLVLVVCVFLAVSKQSTQQPPPRVAQFDVAQRHVITVPIPPGARPPDKLIQGAPVSSGIITTSALSPDGKWLAWGGYDNTVTLWNVATGAEERRLSWARPVSTPTTKLAFSPDGRHLAIIAGGGVNIWDLQNNHTVHSLEVGGELFTYSPDGKQWAAIVAGARDDLTARIEIRNAETGQTVQTIATIWYGVSGMTLTRDGMLVASGTTHQDIGDGSQIITMIGTFLLLPNVILVRLGVPIGMPLLSSIKLLPILVFFVLQAAYYYGLFQLIYFMVQRRRHHL